MAIETGKRRILSALEHELSDDATLRDAIDYLYYLEQIDEGLAEAEAGKLIPHEEVVKQIEQWRR